MRPWTALLPVLLLAAPPAAADADGRDAASVDARTAFAGYVRQASAFVGSASALGLATDRSRVADGANARIESGRIQLPHSPRAVNRTIDGDSVTVSGRNGRRETFTVFGGVTEADLLRSDDAGAFQTGFGWSAGYGAATVTAQSVSGWKPGASADRDVATTVGSLGFTAPGRIGGHSVAISGELSGFHGEASDAAPETFDAGLFLEAEGRSPDGDLTWLWRLERYGGTFKPVAATVAAGRSAAEAAATWRFDDGFRLGARLQRVEEGGGDAVASHTAGASLSIPLPGTASARGALDGEIRRSRNASGDLDTVARKLEWRLESALASGWKARMRAASGAVNSVRGALDAKRFEIAVEADRSLEFAGADLFLSAAAAGRRINDADGRRLEAGPRFKLCLGDGDHRLSLVYSLNAAGSAMATTLAQDARAAYAYRSGPHRLAIEASYVGRDRIETDTPHVYAFGLVYAFSLDFASF